MGKWSLISSVLNSSIFKLGVYRCSDRSFFFFFLSFNEDQYYQTTHEYILDINKINDDILINHSIAVKI